MMEFKYLGFKPPRCKEGHTSGMICIDREAAEYYQGVCRELDLCLNNQFRRKPTETEKKEAPFLAWVNPYLPEIRERLKISLGDRYGS